MHLLIRCRLLTQLCRKVLRQMDLSAHKPNNPCADRPPVCHLTSYYLVMEKLVNIELKRAGLKAARRHG
jgi:hypothetical protein